MEIRTGGISRNRIEFSINETERLLAATFISFSTFNVSTFISEVIAMLLLGWGFDITDTQIATWVIADSLIIWSDVRKVLNVITSNAVFIWLNDLGGSTSLTLKS